MANDVQGEACTQMTDGIVYGLLDSATLELRYVGQTIKSLDRRFAQHTSGGNNPHLNRWLKSTHVNIVALEHSPENLDEAEMRWIQEMQEQGARLINLTEGGRCAVHSPETRTKMSASLKGRVISPEHRAKISATRTGSNLSSEHRTRVSASLLGHKISSETRGKISAAITGRKHSVVARTKMRIAHTGKKHSLETRARIGAAQIGHKHSVEAIAKMVTSQRVRRIREKSA